MSPVLSCRHQKAVFDKKFNAAIHKCFFSYHAKVNPGTFFGVYATIKNKSKPTKPNAAIYLVYDNKIIDKKVLKHKYEPEEIIFENKYFGGKVDLPPVPEEAKKINKEFSLIYALSSQDPLKNGIIILNDLTKNYNCNVFIE